MSYVKTTWVDDTTPINSNNLNNIENGIVANESSINGIKGVTLWQNSNPSAEFAGQTITLSDAITNYNYYSIIFRQATETPRLFNTGMIPTPNGTVLMLSLSTNRYRATNATLSNNQIVFEDAKVVTSSGTNSSSVDIIPVAVIGYNI